MATLPAVIAAAVYLLLRVTRPRASRAGAAGCTSSGRISRHRPGLPTDFDANVGSRFADHQHGAALRIATTENRSADTPEELADRWFGEERCSPVVACLLARNVCSDEDYWPIISWFDEPGWKETTLAPATR